MPSSIEPNGAALVAKVTDIVSRDSSEELAHRKESVSNSSAVRKEMRDHVEDLKDKARAEQEKAEKALKEASGHKWIANVFGAAARDSERAAELNHSATMIQAQAQETQVKVKEQAEHAEEGLDKMKSGLDALEAAKSDIENMQFQNDRQSKKNLGIDDE